MTTIVYDHKSKQVAVDSRSSGGGLIFSDKTDKTRINEKGLWVFCGKTCDIHLLMELSHNDKVEVNPGCSAYLIGNGLAWLITVSDLGYCEWHKLSCSHSLGSGGDFALAAIDFDKSAKEAVEYAMTRDVYTGGKVQVIDVVTGKVI